MFGRMNTGGRGRQARGQGRKHGYGRGHGRGRGRGFRNGRCNDTRCGNGRDFRPDNGPVEARNPVAPGGDAALETCPLCENHCPLSAPSCKQGRAYAAARNQ